MKKDAFEYYEVTQKAIIYDPKTGKFLLLKYPPTACENPDKWMFVGGRIDEGEKIAIKSLEREIREEIGTDVKYEFQGAIDAHIEKRCRIGYLVIYHGGEITLSEEHDEYGWFFAEEVVKRNDLHPGVKQMIETADRIIKERSYLSDLKRLQADFENYKKRESEKQKELGGYLIEKLLYDIIPVLDNFRAATGHVPEAEKGSPWVTGIGYIEKQLEAALAGHGVAVIEVKEGDVFDPKIHEALTDNSQPTTDNEEKTGELKIEKVLQNGYKIGERVVRPAKVTVKSS